MIRIPAFAQGGSSTRREDWFRAWELLRPHTAHGPLDISLVDISGEHLVLEMPITDATRQPYGLLHGGVSMLLAESAASMHASWGLDLRERYPVGIEINGSHLRSAREGRVRATARVLRRTRRLVVHEVRIEHVDSEHLLTTARVTNLVREVDRG